MFTVTLTPVTSDDRENVLDVLSYSRSIPAMTGTYEYKVAAWLHVGRINHAMTEVFSVDYGHAEVLSYWDCEDIEGNPLSTEERRLVAILAITET